MTIRITFKPNGPIALTAEGEDFPVFRTAVGEDIKVNQPAFLCRCGASKKKPFCDGGHVACNYDDSNRCKNDGLKNFESPEITVHFNRSICSGAAQCVRNLPAVFKSSGEDWIQPAEASVEEIIETVKMCPSGALTYSIDGQTEVKAVDEVSVRIVANGPYEITGPVELDAPKWSQNASKTSFALCRCGKTANSPFCDYSHGEQGWEDSK